MKLYLSSYKFGNKIDQLLTMMPRASKIGHINNSRDSKDANPLIRDKHEKEEIEQLNELGFITESLDLKRYFGKENELRDKLCELNGVWVSGGNVFILRQAMKLSGFDVLFDELKLRKSFLYAGYSAGICILSDSLKYIQNVDNPNEFPYSEHKEIIWEGLNVFNYGILPHYDSDHFESAAIDDAIQVCINNKWLFKALRDGEVIIE